MTEATAILPGLSPLEGKELTALFDGERLSSDGGWLVLRKIEKRFGLADGMARCLADLRDPASVRHSQVEMFGARMLATSSGYEDCNDVAHLRGDPVMKMVCGRLPETGPDLMSQPTPSWPDQLGSREGSPRRRAGGRSPR